MNMITMTYCEIEDVIDFTGVKPQNIGLKKDETIRMEEMIFNWIMQAKSLIDTYTNNNFDHDTPKAVESVCIRITANMIALSQARRETPIVKIDDWGVKIINLNIFNDTLKADLAPFVREHSTISDRVDFLTITGD